ncbi:MAG: hypothetical protein GX639_21575 [Fibrobacter sp.]|nr:hypothetical protein [Fibrobacter sp.]
MPDFSSADDALRQIYRWIQELRDTHYQFENRPYDTWVSRHQEGPWVMFADPQLNTIDEAKKSHRPNLYISVTYEDFDTITMGVTYNTNSGVQIFEGLASPAIGSVRNQMLQIIKSISDNWTFTVYRKRKINNFAAPPRYTEEKSWKCHEITDKELTEILVTIKYIRNTRDLPGSIYNGSTLLWEVPSLDVMHGSFSRTKENVCARFCEAYTILNSCLTIPSPDSIDVGESRLTYLRVKMYEIERMLNRSVDKTKRKRLETFLAECKGEIADITGAEEK